MNENKIKFVIHHLKKLFSPAWLFISILYNSFAWFLSTPPFNVSAIYSTEKLTDQYDLVLYTLGLFSFLLIVLTHFNREMKKEYREIIGTRFSGLKVYWGLVVCYFLFFMIGFVFPAYLTAIGQQLIFAPHTISFSILVIKLVSGLFGNIFIWIILSIWLYTQFQDEFPVLISIFFVYLCAFFLNLFTSGIILDQFWLAQCLAGTYSSGYIFSRLFIWFSLMSFMIYSGNIIGKKFLSLNMIRSYKKGIFSLMAEKSKAYLSMHHLDMMGLNSQKILLFFTFIGLVFLIIVIQNPDAQMIVLIKVYLGGLLPILFSFNQHYLIKTDQDAGMIHNNFLRKTSYAAIIINRWLLLLVPQISIVFIYTILISLFSQNLPMSFILYILLLNVFCSIANLFFAVLLRISGMANFILFSFIYIQLRDDIQTILIDHHWLNKINIFYVLLQDEHFIPTIHWIVLFSVVIVLFLVTMKMINRLKYAEVGIA